MFFWVGILAEGLYMQMTTFQGVIENGQVQFDTEVEIPEKTGVYVVVPGFEGPAINFDLADMVSRMPSGYQSGEEDFGVPVGKEEW